MLSDFSNTSIYHPMVESSDTTNGQRRGVGAQRFCQMYDGGRVEECLTQQDEKARHYTVEVTDHGPFPLTHMVVDIRVHALNATSSRVTYDAEFTPKFGPLGWVMGKLMMERKFSTMLGQVIEGAKEHLTTGRTVGRDGARGVQAVSA